MATSPGSPRRGRPHTLSYERIGEAVIEMGLESFSVRGLAEHLGVVEKTLYNYAPGRTGLVALGMEHAMRRSPEAPVAFWTDRTGWRELLEGVAAQAWRFMNAVPGVGSLIAQGVHSRAEAAYTAQAGAALMRRGFGADQALEALVLVFDLVTTAFVRRGATSAESREQLLSRLAPGTDADSAEQTLFDATARAMAVDAEAALNRRLAIVLDGIAVRYGLG